LPVSPARAGAHGVLDPATLFRLRGLLPLPVVFVIVAWSQPTPASFLYGGAAVLLGTAVRFWAAGYFEGRGLDEFRADLLVTAGPYAFVRHPVYLGNFLIGLGFCVVANWWLAFPLYFATFAYVYRAVVAYEERQLAALFGAAYQRYCEEVPRFWPRLSPYRAGSGRFSVINSLRGEWLAWCAHAALAALFAVKLIS